MLARRRAAAIANGDLVDLAADVDEGAVAAAAAALVADAEAAEREKQERSKEAKLQRFRDRIVRDCRQCYFVNTVTVNCSPKARGLGSLASTLNESRAMYSIASGSES